MRMVLPVESHPYSDFAKDGAGKADIADPLKQAWELARSESRCASQLRTNI